MKIIKKKTKIKTTKALKVTKLNTKLALAKNRNVPAYYHCLANKATQGWSKSGKITSCCKECKQNSSQLALQRQQEIKKLGLAYKQLGLSLTKLLQS